MISRMNAIINNNELSRENDRYMKNKHNKKLYCSSLDAKLKINQVYNEASEDVNKKLITIGYRNLKFCVLLINSARTHGEN